MIDLEDPGLESPDSNDFRRAAKGVPLIQVDGKYQRYSRSSSAGKILDDESGLNFWQICTTLIGAAQRPDLMAQVSLLDYETHKGEIYKLAEDCLVTGKGRQRAVTGTAIHSMLDHVDLKHDWTPAPGFVVLVQSYIDTLHRWGLEVVDVECKCVHDGYRLAGTMDRRYRSTKLLVTPDGSTKPIGSVFAADTKTGAKLEYASGTYATQLAAYAASVRYDPQTDERSPFDPGTEQDWGLVVHMDQEKQATEIYWVDLEAGRHGLALANEVRTWRRRSDLLTLARAPLVGITASKASEAVQDAPDSALDAAVRSWLVSRLQAIQAAGPDALRMVQRVWPVGVAGLKQTGQTPEDLAAIAEACSAVEKEFALTFPEADPRRKAEPRNRTFTKEKPLSVAPAFTESENSSDGVAGPSDRWGKPEVTQPDNETDDYLRKMLDAHPRRDLVRQWGSLAMESLDPAITDRIPLAHALYEFGLLEGEDADLTEMLEGTLRAMGYEGLSELGKVPPSDTPVIMSSAFALSAGTALLLIDEGGKPIIRNIKQI